MRFRSWNRFYGDFNTTNSPTKFTDSVYLVIVALKLLLVNGLIIIRVVGIGLILLLLNTALLQAQSTLEFERLDKLPVGVFDMGFCASEKAIFSIGGQIVQGGEIKNTEVIMIYSPFTDEWSKALFTSGDIAVKGTSTSTYLKGNNSIYTLALSKKDEEGRTTYPLEVFNLDNYRLTYDESNPHRAALAGIASDEQNLYIFGGYSTNEDGEFEFNKQLHKYDPVTSEWVELSNLPEGRRSKGVIVNEQLYVIGGEVKDGITSEVIKYDLARDRWSSIGYLPNASDAHSIAASNEHIFVITGNEQADKLLVINSKTNDIDQFSIRFGFQKPGLAILEGYLYLFGGYAPRSNTANRKTLRISLQELIK